MWNLLLREDSRLVMLYLSRVFIITQVKKMLRLLSSLVKLVRKLQYYLRQITLLMLVL